MYTFDVKISRKPLANFVMVFLKIKLMVIKIS